MKRSITESLVVDTESLEWECRRCEHPLGPVAENYKKGCLIAQRDPKEIWEPLIEGVPNFSYDDTWSRIVEFYCPGCGALLEVEMLPPGHPITHDIELDLTTFADEDSVDRSSKDSEQ